jgi:uncharacterized cupredoxin-like copper-binding protein
LTAGFALLDLGRGEPEKEVPMSLAFRVVAILAFACAVLTIPAVAADATVAIDHGDFYVTAEPAPVEAGTITFDIINSGKVIHEFKVVQSDLAPDSLPLIEEEFLVDESQVNVLGFTDIMQPGATRTMVLNMPPGNYVLICNIASHYQAGSYLGFQVTAPPAPTAPANGGPTPTVGPPPPREPPAVGGGPQGGDSGSWWVLAMLCAFGVGLTALGFATSRPGR